MPSGKRKQQRDLLEYQPDAVEIEERPVPGRIRWVLYLILGTLVAAVVWATLGKVDRVVVAEGHLITTSPTIVVQPLNTAMIRSVEVKVGEVVSKNQLLATMDSTFASADLSQLTKQRYALNAQLRRIRAELSGTAFVVLPEEGEDGRLQEEVLSQHRMIVEKNLRLNQDKIKALEAKLAMNKVQRQGQSEQVKLLRDVEGNTARLLREDPQYRLRLLDAQKARLDAVNTLNNLEAEQRVYENELQQAKSEWQRFMAEHDGELMEQEVQLRSEFEKANEEINKARRLHELVSLRAPQDGIVLSIAERSVGSIIQQAEPFITLVPLNSTLEAEVNVQSKDIARIRLGDSARIKLDAFPFQRHDTLPGEVRVISENAFSRAQVEAEGASSQPEEEVAGAYYRTRLTLLSTQLRNVPEGFRLMPGMQVRAEIKVGQRSIISYFLYPVIRALDESLREP